MGRFLERFRARFPRPAEGDGRLKTVRLFRTCLAAPIGAGLLAAACIVALGCGPAAAQLASPDPLAPKLSDPRKPARFQKSDRPVVEPVIEAAPVFTGSVPAAGDTGFDSTNSRKRKARAKSKGAPAPKTPNNSPIFSDSPAAPAISPYQKPLPLSGSAPANGSGLNALASAPGAPPVDLGPIRKAPPKRKAHVEPDDPYAPLGVRAGGFTLYPAIELIGGYNTNPAQSSDAKGASLYSIAPELQAQSNWSRHELKADLRGSYTGYSPDSDPSLSRPNINGKVDGRVDVTKLTRIDLGGRVQVATDNPNSPNLQAGLSRLPVYTTYGGTAGLGQKFNRFDLSLKGDAERTVYQDSSLTDGSTASNEDRNYDQYTVTLRGGYELSPGLMPFVEGSTDARKHDLATDFSGYQRNSKGMTGKVGATFELSRLLSGEVSLGYTQRKYDDARLDNLSGLIGDASLVWSASALTTVKFTAKSSVGEATTPGVSGVLYRDAGLQVDHSFRRWLIGSIKLGFGLDDYIGMSREDKRYAAGAGLTYKLNRSTQIKGEFRQEWLRSNVTGNDYSASIVLLGLRFQM
jgi:hypothetical protein